METIKDGGPAFPTQNEHQTDFNTFHYAGMTLRDYFAAKAMQALIGRYGNGEGLADSAYNAADAMIAQREKHNDNQE